MNMSTGLQKFGLASCWMTFEILNNRVITKIEFFNVMVIVILVKSQSYCLFIVGLSSCLVIVWTKSSTVVLLAMPGKLWQIIVLVWLSSLYITNLDYYCMLKLLMHWPLMNFMKDCNNYPWYLCISSLFESSEFRITCKFVLSFVNSFIWWVIL